MSAYISWVWTYAYPNKIVASAEYTSLERCEQAYIALSKEGSTRGHVCTEK